MSYVIASDECECEAGWGRKSCLVDLTVGPEISYITGSGTCDLYTDDCIDFIIETGGLGEIFFAKVTKFEVMFSVLAQHCFESLYMYFVI